MIKKMANYHLFIFVVSTIMVLALCSGVVFARLTLPASFTANIPLATPTVTLWAGQATGSATQVTGTSVTLNLGTADDNATGDYLWAKVTTNGLKCVVRVFYQITSSVTSSNKNGNWIPQQNGWRYYYQTTTGNNAFLNNIIRTKVDGLTLRVTAEIVQIEGATAANSVISEWASLEMAEGEVKHLAANGNRVRCANKTSAVFNTSLTDYTGPDFGVYVGSSWRQVKSLASTGSIDVLNKTSVVYADLSTSDNVTFTAAQFSHNNAVFNYMTFYNNVGERELFIIRLGFLFYDDDNNLISGVEISSFSVGFYSPFVAVTGMENTWAGIGNSGTYLQVFNKTPNLSITLSAANSNVKYARPVFSLTVVDVDKFQIERDIDVEAGNTTDFTMVYDSLKAASKLMGGTNTYANASQYLYWLKWLSSNATVCPYYNLYRQHKGYSV